MPISPHEHGVAIRQSARGLLTRARRRMADEGARTLSDARRRAPSRTGALARSLRLRLDTRTGVAGFSITSLHPGARILEYGGAILPRTVQYLAIPLRGQTVWPRHVGRHIVITARSGRLYLFRDRPRDGGRPEYELVRRVDVRARPYLRPALAAARRRLRRVLPGVVTARSFRG